jgi:hypothetical protein
MTIDDVKKIKAQAELVLSRCDEVLLRAEHDDEFARTAGYGGYRTTGALKRAIQEFVYVTIPYRK